MKLLLPFLALLLTFTGCATSHTTAVSSDTRGSFYDSMPLPSQDENQALQRAAQKRGFDFLGALHDMSEDDLQSWSQVFSLSMDFTSDDRSAQVYGYYIFTSWLYFVESCGCEKYAKLVDAQPAAVRQRIRDFLYLYAIMQPKEIRESKERELRQKCPSVFPADYAFGEDDALFRRLTSR